NFPASLTANTPVNPNTLDTGSGVASFLLGAMDPGATQMIGGPAPDPHIKYWGMFFQDDWKLNRNITLNLGLRNEYETAFYDPARNFARGVDLSAPIPEMNAAPPQMPAQALAIVGSNYFKWNGLYQWTGNGNPGGMWDPQKFALQPRAGIAIRISDRTAFRAGYARYITPMELGVITPPISGFETIGFLSPPYFGVTGFQNPAPLIDGVPQARFSDPFPANSNPLLPINGKAAGTNVGRGQTSGMFWYPTDLKRQRNDRINFNLQHQFPGEIVASVTWFMNFGNQHYTKALNEVDPRLRVEYQNTLNQPVDNPFYNYLTPELMPGQLRNLRQVSLGSLLRPYPHYGPLYQIGTLGARERYHSLELKAQKMYSKGYNFLFAYVYIREKLQINTFNDLDYFSGTLRWQDSNQPRHRITAAGTWDLPFGKGRPFLNNAPRALDAAIGGWKLAGVWTFSTGAFIRFGNLIVNGNPCLDNPTPQRWFNTDAFSRLPANTYVLRTNPLQYDCLTGPKFSQLDATLTKDFAVTERVRVELKMAAYNATNRLNRAGPNTDINSSQFGTALFQGTPSSSFGAQNQELGNITGRQVELGLKIRF
ncbi:MAG: TonB-dependent receptor, partial [Bryobacteraceae bacterium]|nr:TonB-dependent receptor [Bryobacteraceae bacterium]